MRLASSELWLAQGDSPKRSNKPGNTCLGGDKPGTASRRERSRAGSSHGYEDVKAPAKTAPARYEPRDSRPLLAIGLKVASIIVFLGMSICLKAAGALPLGQLVFYRSAFAIIPIMLMLAWQRKLLTGFRTSHPYSHVLRGLVGVFSMGLQFFALTRLPLPEAVTLNYAQPLFVIVFSAIFLGEVIRAYRWGAVAVGLVGVVIISWPNLSLFTSGSGFTNAQAAGVAAALTATAVSAVAMLLVRRLVKTEESATIVLWFSLTSTIAGLLTLPFGWAPLSWTQFSLLVGAGLCGGVAQILMTEGYRHAEVSTVAPFEYTSMIWAIAAGYFLFGEVASVNMLFGGLIVIGAGLFIIWREHRLGLERAAARRVTPPGT
jgi:drug/metabolite transporter (DMT)-like permease